MYDELVKKIRNCATDPMHCLSCGEDKDGRCFKRLMTQAADAIEELSKRMDESIPKSDAEIIIGELSKSPWIPVSERLPDVPGTYLVLVKEPKKYTESRMRGEVEEWENFDFSHVEPAFYNKDQGIWGDDDDPMNANLDVVNTYEAFHVTHWMPLPKGPEEE